MDKKPYAALLTLILLLICFTLCSLEIDQETWIEMRKMELAVRCLLGNGDASDLRPHAAIDLEAPGRATLIRNEIRKAGWMIIDRDDEFSIKPFNAAKTRLRMTTNKSFSFIQMRGLFSCL
jgi:hypothetical protein